jgi:mannose-6-phosphate isomerase-like protein (cupin superfamily)
MNNYILLDKGDLRHYEHTDEFEGDSHGDTQVSFILVDMPPGSGVRLHRHAYQEIFLVQEGEATYTIGSETLEVKAPQIVIVPSGVPHKFTNSGNGPLKQVDIHLSGRMVTEWLEGPSPSRGEAPMSGW